MQAIRTLWLAQLTECGIVTETFGGKASIKVHPSFFEFQASLFEAVWSTILTSYQLEASLFSGLDDAIKRDNG